MRSFLLVMCVCLLSCSGMVDLPGATGGGNEQGGGSATGGSSSTGGSGGSGGSAGGTAGGSSSAGGGTASVDAGPADAGQPDAGRTVWVIGGQDMRHLISFDGRTWQHDSYIASNGLDNAFTGVAIGAGCIIMSGDPGIFRSTDGINYTLVQAKGQGFGFHSSQARYANGMFLVVAGDRAWRSTDGITWQFAASTGNSGHWHELVWGNGKWIAVGDNVMKLSEDGITWHDFGPFTGEKFRAIAYGNQRFMAVGKVIDAGWVATSADGLTWTDQPTVPTTYSTGLSSIAFGNGVFLTSTCCSTLASTDGVTWTQLGNNANAGRTVFAGGQFVSAGWRTEAKYFVPDAGRWSSGFTGTQPNLYDDAGIAPWFTGFNAGEL